MAPPELNLAQVGDIIKIPRKVVESNEAKPLIRNKSEFEHEDKTEQDSEGWTPLDYMEHYIDKDLMKKIANCSNATICNTSTDEIYHFLSCNQNILV